MGLISLRHQVNCLFPLSGSSGPSNGILPLGVNEFESTNFPSFEEGSLRPSRKMSRYLSQGAAGEVRTLLQQWLDLPGRAEFKVALHLLDRRGHSQEGN